jgi:hypothetical protein
MHEGDQIRQIRQWIGQDVHTLTFAWCKFTRDGTTLVIASGTHEHG